MQIREFAKLTGVSVRTLHYYDEIGLLTPSSVDKQTNYRFYDENSLARMQEILFFRELDFPLKSIGEFLSSPHYDREQALLRQKELLILKKERLERLIAAVDSAAKGENIMKAFDSTQLEETRKQYETEVRERWGHTEAYAEFTEKTKGYSQNDHRSAADGLEQVMAEFAACMTQGMAPESAEAQALAAKLQSHITAQYYTCTKEILAGLGQMYTADDRFRANIDKHAPGTAEYVSRAIAAYCK